VTARRRDPGSRPVIEGGWRTLLAFLALLVVAVMAAVRGRYGVTAAMTFAFVVYGTAVLMGGKRERKEEDDGEAPEQYGGASDAQRG